jgi:signal transduction histidine kinase
VKQLLEKGNVQDLEVRIRRKDGQIRTMLGSTELIDFGGEPCGLTVFTDITERKQAEAALAGVSRKLIEAQEQERTRIARELHDDINQRIAMLAVDLDRLQQSMSGSDPETGSQVKGLQKRLMDIGIEVQTISHRLHSSKLEFLGLAVACRGFCREVAERHKVTVSFSADDIPSGLPRDISLCLFRVLQESLTNAIKYSGVQRFDVHLRRLSDDIEISVRDRGTGFDVDAAMNGKGLGLISMRERASLVNGTVSIASTPTGGTQVTIRVPLKLAPETNETAIHATPPRRADGVSARLAG